MAFPLRREMNDNRYYKHEKSYNQHRSGYEKADEHNANSGLNVSGRGRRGAQNTGQSVQTPHPAANAEDKACGNKSKGNNQQDVFGRSQFHKFSQLLHPPSV